MNMLRYMIAKGLCRHLPPAFSLRLREFIYPRRLAYQDDFEFTVKSQTGSLYRGHTSDYHGYIFAIHGFFALRNLAIAKALCTVGDTVVEIGANVGTETIGFSDIVGDSGKVYAFEPLPSNLVLLEKSLAWSQFKNIKLVPCALGDRCGTVSFATPPNDHSSGIGYVLQEKQENNTKVIDVDCVTLDSLTDQIGPAKMMFIDVEGLEVLVLRGARNYLIKYKPNILLEAKPKWLARANFDLLDLHQELRNLEYNVFDAKNSRLRLRNPNLGTSKGTDWLCIHQDNLNVLKQVETYLWKCRFLPFVFGLNPLARRHIQKPSQSL